MKVEKIILKGILILILAMTFYVGFLQSPYITNPAPYPLLSGIMSGLFIMFLIISIKVFKS